MPSYENPAENLPATLPEEAKEELLVEANPLPKYEGLPELTPDQAQELIKSRVLLGHLFDMDDILKAAPDDFHGHKKAIRELLGAVYGLIDVYAANSMAMKAEAEDQDDYTGKMNARRWTTPLENALRELGYIPEHLRGRL